MPLAHNPNLPALTVPPAIGTDYSYILVEKITDGGTVWRYDLYYFFSSLPNNFTAQPYSGAPTTYTEYVSSNTADTLYKAYFRYDVSKTTGLAVLWSTNAAGGTTTNFSSAAWYSYVWTSTIHIREANQYLVTAVNYDLRMTGTGYLIFAKSSSNDYEDVLKQTFTPDPGLPPDAGGGDQDFGQGVPGTSTTPGDFNDTSDTAVGTKYDPSHAGQYFNNYYVLNKTHLTNLKYNLWHAPAIPGLTKPQDGILSLFMFPFDLNAIAFDTTQGNIKVGNSLINADVATNPVYMLDPDYSNDISFGTLTVDPYFGGFQDYSPYTKIRMYIPFVGFVDLDPQYVIGKEIGLKFHVNFTLGSFVAVITSGGYVIQKHNGQIGQSVPMMQIDNPLLEATANTAIQAATLAIANPVAGGVAAITGSLSNIVNARPSISSSAGGNGEENMSLPMTPYLVIERPDCVVAQTYNSEKGRPSMINKQLSNCKGFTKMVNPKVTAKCTQAENDVINAKLREGVIING